MSICKYFIVLYFSIILYCRAGILTLNPPPHTHTHSIDLHQWVIGKQLGMWCFFHWGTWRIMGPRGPLQTLRLYHHWDEVEQTQTAGRRQRSGSSQNTLVTWPKPGPQAGSEPDSNPDHVLYHNLCQILHKLNQKLDQRGPWSGQNRTEHLMQIRF